MSISEFCYLNEVFVVYFCILPATVVPRLGHNCTDPSPPHTPLALVVRWKIFRGRRHKLWWLRSPSCRPWQEPDIDWISRFLQPDTDLLNSYAEQFRRCSVKLVKRKIRIKLTQKNRFVICHVKMFSYAKHTASSWSFYYLKDSASMALKLEFMRISSLKR